MESEERRGRGGCCLLGGAERSPGGEREHLVSSSDARPAAWRATCRSRLPPDPRASCVWSVLAWQLPAHGDGAGHRVGINNGAEGLNGLTQMFI